MGPGGAWVPQFLMKMALEVSKTRHFRCAGYGGGLRPESATLTIIHAQSGAPVDVPGATGAAAPNATDRLYYEGHYYMSCYCGHLRPY